MNNLYNSHFYFFIFGRNPQLSKAEIISYLASHSIGITSHISGKDFLLLNIPEKINSHKVSQDLASIVKIGRIYLSIQNIHDLTDLLQQMDFYIEDSNTITYSISTYGDKVNSNDFHGIFKQLYKHYKIKALLKNPPPSTLSNALKKTNFVDIVVFHHQNQYYIGRSIASYDIKEDKKRYEQRPHVDESIGSSIRISRILVNLSQKIQGKLLDPFCGIGTILQEAILMGYEVIGSEINPKRVRFCQDNLKWITEQYPNIRPKLEIFQSDVREIYSKIPPLSIDTIVTEPELGPFLKAIPTWMEAKSIIDTLQALYEDAFRVMDDILKPKGTIVFVLPELETTGGKKTRPNIHSLITSTHFKLISEIAYSTISLPLPIFYKEKWHIIGRWIYVFQKS